MDFIKDEFIIMILINVPSNLEINKVTYRLKPYYFNKEVNDTLQIIFRCLI